MPRRLEIEKALSWAYRDELPKTPRAGGLIKTLGLPAVWRRVDKYGELLEVIDEDGLNQWGVYADPLAVAAPHPDAITIAEAVKALGGLRLDLPADWDPLGDLELGDDRPAILARAVALLTVVERDGSRRLKASPGRLVQRAAILGAPDDWQVDEIPTRVEVRNAQGGSAWFRRVLIAGGECVNGDPAPAYEVEVDGFDHKRRRPHPEAYRKFVWDPDPAELAVDRGLYEIWRSALDLLVEDLAGALDELELVASTRSRRPWIEPDQVGRILPNLAPWSPTPVAIEKRPRRKSVRTS